MQHYLLRSSAFCDIINTEKRRAELQKKLRKREEMKLVGRRYAVVEFDYDADKFVITAEGTHIECTDYVFDHYDDPFADDDIYIIRAEIAHKIEKDEELTEDEFSLLPCSMWILL